MFSLKFYDHNSGLKYLRHRLSDLCGKSLLDLRACRRKFKHSAQLADSGDLALGQVAHSRVAEKRQKVVFTNGEKGQLRYRYRVIGLGLENRVYLILDPCANTSEERLVHTCNTGRSLLQALALRVFANGLEDLGHGALYAVVLDRDSLLSCRDTWLGLQSPSGERHCLNSLEGRLDDDSLRRCAGDGQVRVLQPVPCEYTDHTFV